VEPEEQYGAGLTMAGSQGDPYVEFPFDRITEVHWKKKGNGGGPEIGQGSMHAATNLSTDGTLPAAPFEFYSYQGGSGGVGDAGNSLGCTGGSSVSMSLHGSAYCGTYGFTGVLLKFSFQVSIVDLITGANLFTSPPVQVETPLDPTQFWGPFSASAAIGPGAQLQQQLEIVSIDNPILLANGGVGCFLDVTLYA
jgi:hypothetical protein